MSRVRELLEARKRETLSGMSLREKVALLLALREHTGTNWKHLSVPRQP